MSISDIASQFVHHGIAKNNRFEISGSAVPNALITNSYIRSVQYPNKSVAQMTVRDVGVPIKYPYDIIFGEITLSFMDTDKLDIYKWYNKWFEIVFSTGKEAGGNIGFDYYDNYVKDMTVKQMDENNVVQSINKLHNCYIGNISEITFNHEATNPATFSITLSYEHSTLA